MIHYQSPIKTVLMTKNQVYHIEILQGGRFYAEYSLFWRKHLMSSREPGEFKEVTVPSLLHTETTRQRLPSFLWLKNPPKKNYQYTEEENRRLKYNNLPVFNISKKLFSEGEESSSTTRSTRLSSSPESQGSFDKSFPEEVKCPKMSWYKRNITKLYLGRLFVDYHLVYPKNFFHYTGGWPSNHLLLDETKAWQVANKTMERLRKIYKRYKIINIY